MTNNKLIELIEYLISEKIDFEIKAYNDSKIIIEDTLNKEQIIKLAKEYDFQFNVDIFYVGIQDLKNKND